MRAFSWVFVLGVAACPSGGGGGGGGDLSWYTTCGDPVCGGYQGPFEGVALCTTEVVDAACDHDGAQCDPEDDCDALLVCADADPKDQTGGCPISRRKYKHDIHYLSVAERDALAREALDLPLATWRYNGTDDTLAPRLGFIIDDRPGSPAVAADGDHVDVYGLAAMAIAGMQAQQAEIEALKLRQRELERELEARGR